MSENISLYVNKLNLTSSQVGMVLAGNTKLEVQITTKGAEGKTSRLH